MSNASGSFHMDYERSFKGPTKSRSCTDLYCLFIFVAFIIGWLAVANYAYWNGDIDRIYSPSDSNGQICGVDTDVKDKKYLLFFDISQCISMNVFLFGCPTKQLCVSECPVENWFSDSVFNKPPAESEWKYIREKLICLSKNIANSITSLQSLKTAIEAEKCASYYIRSIPVGNVCIPTFVKLVNGSICIADDSLLEKLCLPDITSQSHLPLESIEVGSNSIRTYFYTFVQTLHEVQNDLMKCWHIIAIFTVGSALMCLFFIAILSIVARLMVWLIFVIIVILLCYCTFASYTKYKSFNNVTIIESEDNITTPKTGFWIYDTFKDLMKKQEFWSVLTVVCSSSVVGFLLLVIFLRKRINLAILIVREGSRAINDIKSTLLFPTIPLILKLGIILWFLLIFGYLKTLGNSVYTVQGLKNDTDCICSGVNYQDRIWCLPHQFRDNCHSKIGGVNSTCNTAQCKFVGDRTSTFIFYLQAYNFFGLLWGFYFISGFGRIILSYCFASWYWTFNKNDIPYFMLITSVLITIRYHLGTIAVGSFLISTLSFIRKIIEYLHKNLKKYDNIIAQCLFWSCRWCFWILQKFLTFVSENAYTMCAVYGEGFWSSAQSAVGLLFRNIIRVAVLDKVVDFLILMGKVGLTCSMTVLAFYTFQEIPLTYPWVPTVIIGLATWIIASTFFSVYSVAVDTLFLCFLKDGEINDGSQQKPYYMSQNLKYILRKNVDHEGRKISPS